MIHSQKRKPFYKIALKPNVGLVIVGDMNRLRAQAADVR
jgi:hypothetical protein